MSSLGNVKVTQPEAITRQRGRRGTPCSFLCGYARDGNLPSGLKALHHLVAVLVGRKQVASLSKVLGNGPISSEESLGVLRRLKSPHAPLSLPRRLVRNIYA